MTEEQKQALIHELESRRAIMRIDSDKLWEYDWFADEAYRIALAALTQPASPALKLPDPFDANDAKMFCAAHRVTGAYELASQMANYAVDKVKRLNAPHTAPIEPICATGGAEWVSNERVEEIIYRAEMFGHGAGYLPNEVIPMAKELLALRKSFSEPVAYRKLIKDEFDSRLDRYDYFECQGIGNRREPLYRKP